MARSTLLLDSGGLVSLLDRSQKHHREFAHFYESWEGSVVSTEAVLTEATHLLGRIPGGSTTCLAFFLNGGAQLVPSNRRSLERCRQLMDKYSDLPMDYADATLVALAEEIGTTRLVLTTDRRDFSIYRLLSGESFELLP